MKAAEILRDSGFFYKAVSSACFADYHAARALLLLKGVAPRSHEGVDRMFYLYYVKTGEAGLAVGKIIGRLMKQREGSDYYPEAVFTREESSDAISQGRTFLAPVKDIFPEK